MMVMNMINKINFKALTGMVVAFYVAYITATGEILNYTKFEDPLNEMVFCALALVLGVGCMMSIKK